MWPGANKAQSPLVSRYTDSTKFIHFIMTRHLWEESGSNLSHFIFRPLWAVKSNESKSRNVEQHDGKDRPWTVGLNLISSLDNRLIQGWMRLCRVPQCQICYEGMAQRLECVVKQKSADCSLNWLCFTLFSEHSLFSSSSTKYAIDIAFQNIFFYLCIYTHIYRLNTVSFYTLLSEFLWNWCFF